MKNVVEDKFEWQFLKMTEIENDIKKLHNRFEIPRKQLLQGIKKFESIDSKFTDTSNVEKVEDSNEDIQTETVIQPSKDSSASLENLEVLSREEELYMRALELFERGQINLAEQRFSEFIESYPTSLKL